MKTINEFSETATAEQIRRLVEYIGEYWPKIDAECWRETRSQEPWQWVIRWRRRKLVAVTQAEFLRQLIGLLSAAVQKRKNNLNLLVWFFQEELGWPVTTTAELRDALLAEMLTV